MKPLTLSRTALALALSAVMTACGGAGDNPPDTSASAEAAPAPVPGREEVRFVRAEETGDKPAAEPEGEEASGGNSLAAAGAAANAEAADVAARGLTEIGWEDLMPEGEEEKIAEMYQAQMARLYAGGGIAEGSAADQAIQIGTFNTVEEIYGQQADGMKVRLPGYTVPFEYGKDAEISEFLLVPYYGACLHAPPPPPNQTVFVTTDDPIKLKDLSQAVWIEGTLRLKTQSSDLADTAYTIEMTGWSAYEY